MLSSHFWCATNFSFGMITSRCCQVIIEEIGSCVNKGFSYLTDDVGLDDVELQKKQIRYTLLPKMKISKTVNFIIRYAEVN